MNGKGKNLGDISVGEGTVVLDKKQKMVSNKPLIRLGSQAVEVQSYWLMINKLIQIISTLVSVVVV